MMDSAGSEEQGESGSSSGSWCFLREEVDREFMCAFSSLLEDFVREVVVSCSGFRLLGL